MIDLPPGVGLLGGYLLIGSGFAAYLSWRAMPPAAVLSAVVAWPLLLGLATGSPPPAPIQGRLAARIDSGLDALLETLADPAAASIGWTDDLSELRAALHSLDARVALVDRLLEGTPDTPSAAGLAQARSDALADMEAVLTEVADLRLQVGMQILAGKGDTLQRRLRDLSVRAAAIRELAGL